MGIIARNRKITIFGNRRYAIYGRYTPLTPRSPAARTHESPACPEGVTQVATRPLVHIDTTHTSKAVGDCEMVATDWKTDWLRNIGADGLVVPLMFATSSVAASSWPL